MSDEEAEYSEEEYEEEAEEEAPAQEEYKYGYDEDEEEHKGRQERSKSKVDIELTDNKNLSEGEKAMLLSKKRQEEEDKLKLLDYEERRKYERDQEEEELKKLKEKQEQRRLQREQEDREQAEKAQKLEEKRRQEEEERRSRMEADRKKKEDEKIKRAQLTGMPFAGAQTGGGKNFVIPEKKGGGDRFGNIVQAKQEMGMTKDQQEDAKSAFLVQIKKMLDVSSFHGSELKQKLKEMHQKICKLEAEKYDLEKRNERQTYDLKELNERQRQTFRNKLTKQGVDATETNSRHPPKVRTMSKYDRQTDRRNYNEKRAMYENKIAFPVFPGVPPPPTILEFKVKAIAKKEAEFGDIGFGGYGEEEEAYEEEEE